MAYNELIKNFNRIRDYMREFYVYGFKSREEYKRKSARSYDDERRRVESWLGDYMGFRQTPEGKNVFLSIDSRLSRHNPLYKAWKARSFTDGDMTLHFILLDLLHDPEQGLSLGEITRRIDQDYLSGFEMPRVFDESTVRKKLKEYTEAGVLHTQKQGRVVLYFRTPDPVPACSEALDYFSEVLPCGVIGSYLLEELLASSDVISLHCPAFPETVGIINKNSIAKMKDGVILINNSRGALVVEQDLADALNSGKVAAAAVDVVSSEPISEANPLLSAKNCLITPHISWAPRESRQRIMDCTEENIRCFLAGKPQNLVN